MEEKIQKILDEAVNTQLDLHGGSAELSKYENGVAWIKFYGACANCMSAQDTLDSVVRNAIMNAIPEVKDVQIDKTVSDDLLNMARKILNKEI